MRRRFLAVTAAFAALSTACGDGLSGPGASSTAFSETISFEAFEGSVLEGTTRVEIKLVPGTLVAREIEVKEPEERSEREEIESRVTAVDGVLGTVTLALADLVVSFDGTTSFRAETGEELSRSEFVNRTEESLASGRQPAIEAKRFPAASPQDPEDQTFLATKIEFDDEADEPEIEINVDSDNLIPNDSPPPDAWLRVLGVEIEIRSSEGTTELEEEADRDEAEIEFEGMVASVDEAAATVLLVDGTVLALVADTEIKREGDDDNLPTLSAVVAALDDGALVEADGEGLVSQTDPLVLLVVEVEFEIEDDADDVPGEVDFEGRVVSVDGAAGTLTLQDGRVIVVDGSTRFEDDGDEDSLSSLAQAAEALVAGDVVEADGEGIVESTDPLTIRALELELEIED